MLMCDGHERAANLEGSRWLQALELEHGRAQRRAADNGSRFEVTVDDVAGGNDVVNRRHDDGAHAPSLSSSEGRDVLAIELAVGQIDIVLLALIAVASVETMLACVRRCPSVSLDGRG